MKQFELYTSDVLAHNQNSQYINECCEFCDLLLEKIKPQIAELMEIVLDKINIGQEDWGWYLEFKKEKIFYELNISYQSTTNGKHLFGVIVEANHIKEGFFFTSKISAEDNCRQFCKIIRKISKDNNFELIED